MERKEALRLKNIMQLQSNQEIIEDLMKKNGDLVCTIGSRREEIEFLDEKMSELSAEKKRLESAYAKLLLRLENLSAQPADQAAGSSKCK